jgi:hypothetical protein
MVASNTKDCFRECVGKRVKGVLFDALPVDRGCLAAGTKTLIFEDGSGLTITSDGSFWLEDRKEIQRAVDYRRMELEKTKAEIAEVIAAADGGATVTDGSSNHVLAYYDGTNWTDAA